METGKTTGQYSFGRIGTLTLTFLFAFLAVVALWVGALAWCFGECFDGWFSITLIVAIVLGVTAVGYPIARLRSFGVRFEGDDLVDGWGSIPIRAIGAVTEHEDGLVLILTDRWVARWRQVPRDPELIERLRGKLDPGVRWRAYSRTRDLLKRGLGLSIGAVLPWLFLTAFYHWIVHDLRANGLVNPPALEKIVRREEVRESGFAGERYGLGPIDLPLPAEQVIAVRMVGVRTRAFVVYLKGGRRLVAWKEPSLYEMFADTPCMKAVLEGTLGWTKESDPVAMAETIVGWSPPRRLLRVDPREPLGDILLLLCGHSFLSLKGAWFVEAPGGIWLCQKSGKSPTLVGYRLDRTNALSFLMRPAPGEPAVPVGEFQRWLASIRPRHPPDAAESERLHSRGMALAREGDLAGAMLHVVAALGTGDPPRPDWLLDSIALLVEAIPANPEDLSRVRNSLSKQLKAMSASPQRDQLLAKLQGTGAPGSP